MMNMFQRSSSAPPPRAPAPTLHIRAARAALSSARLPSSRSASQNRLLRSSHGCQNRAHLHRHQTRRRAARPDGRNRQALRAEGLQTGGHEVPSGVRGPAEAALHRPEGPALLPRTRQVHELRPGSGHGVGGSERCENRKGDARRDQSRRLQTRNHQGRSLHRSGQEHHPWQRLRGQRQ